MIVRGGMGGVVTDMLNERTVVLARLTRAEKALRRVVDYAETSDPPKIILAQIAREGLGETNGEPAEMVA